MTTDTERYLAAAHAMQSGVAMEMNIPDSQPATSPKHLRTGINVALADQGSLVRLLIAKGVFTEPEYRKAIADGMEEEKRKYETDLSKHFGRKITLI